MRNGICSIEQEKVKNKIRGEIKKKERGKDLEKDTSREIVAENFSKITE